MGMDRALQLVEDHWNYIQGLLKSHRCEEDTIRIVDFHYKTAFMHGYKHGIEDSEERNI